MKTKLLFVNGHLEVGGVEKSLVDILRWLDYSQYDVDLLLLEGEGTYKERIPSEVNIVFVDTTKAYGAFLPTIKKCLKKRDLSTLWYRSVISTVKLFGKKSLRLLTPVLGVKTHYDCAIAYRPGICADVVAYAVRASKKLCWWHHGEINYNKTQIKTTNIVWKHFSNIVTVSYGCKSMLENHFTSCIGKTVVIPNMIDVNDITAMAGTNSPFTNTSGKAIIVTVGRLSPEKHIENVVYAAKTMIENDYTHFIWYIIGDGQLRKDIQEKIHRLKVGTHVIMLGNKSNPYPYIKFADLLVHTSYVESQCLTVFEAIALHTPCIITRSIGPTEYIEQNKYQYFVETDYESLAKRIIQDINCPQKTHTFNINTKFDPSNIISSISSIILSA